MTRVTNLHLAMAVAMNVPERNMKEYAAWVKANHDKAFYAKALQSPDVAAKLAALNMEAVGSTREEFARTIATDWAKWGAIAKASGFTLE